MYIIKTALRHLINPFQRFKLSVPSSFNTDQLSDYKAAVLICSEDFSEDEYAEVLCKEAANHFKDYLILLFVPGRRKDTMDNPHYLLFDGSKFSYTGRIESSVMSQLTERKFDLLISLSDCKRPLYLQCLKDFPASFKAGITKHGQNGFFHLTCHSDLIDETP